MRRWIRKSWRAAGLGVRLGALYSIVLTLILISATVVFSRVVSRLQAGITVDEAVEASVVAGESLVYAALLDTEADLRGLSEAATAFARQAISAARQSGHGRGEVLQELRRYLSIEGVESDGYLVAIETDGTVVFHPSPSLTGTQVTDEATFRDITETGNGVIRYAWRGLDGEAEPGRVGYVRFIDDFGLYIVATDYTESLVGHIPTERLQEMVEAIRSPTTPHIVLRNRGGSAIASATDAGLADRLVTLRSTRPATVREPDGSTRSLTSVEDFVLIRQWNERLGAELEVVFDASRRNQVTSAYRRVAVAGALLGFLLVMTASRFVSRSISTPIARVTRLLDGLVDQTARGEEAVSSGNELVQLLTHQISIARRLRFERTLRQREYSRRLVTDVAFQSTTDGICVVACDGEIVRANPAMERILGLNQNGRPGEKLQHLVRDLATVDSDGRLVPGWMADHAVSREVRVDRRDGTRSHFTVTASPTPSDVVGRGAYVVVFHDISELSTMRERLRHMADHDGLTGLPNRGHFERLASDALEVARRNGEVVGLLFVDLDNFKDVNDSLGHLSGDQFLQAMADRIGSVLRTGDQLGRFGGDEFVVLVRGNRTADSVELIARRILEELHEPYELEGSGLRPSASIGISVFPDDAATTVELLRNADAAMYSVKSESKNGFRFHDPAMNSAAHSRLRVRGAVGDAIENDELAVEYQPIYELAGDRIVGVEALVRWHREGKLVPPGDFLPYLAQSPMMSRLDLWVLRCALEELASLHFFSSGRYVTINVAPNDLTYPHFVEQFVEQVNRSGVPRGSVRAEVTESDAIRNLSRTRDGLTTLKASGIGVFLDDFGEGYSSIRSLRELGIDAVKLDRGYVARVPESRQATSFLRGFIQLAHGMGVEAIVEGVEHDRQADFLRAEGADLAQGYLFGRPGSVHDLATALHEPSIAIAV